jgi:hypothetical protein
VSLHCGLHNELYHGSEPDRSDKLRDLVTERRRQTAKPATRAAPAAVLDELQSVETEVVDVGIHMRINFNEPGTQCTLSRVVQLLEG